MSVSGYPVFLGAVVIHDGNNAFRFEVNAVPGTVTIANGTYFLRGDGSSDDLIQAIIDAMETHSAGDTFDATAVYFQRAPDFANLLLTIDITSSAHTFRFLFANAATTFDASLIGFPQTDGVAATQLSASLSSSAVWVGDDVTRSLEPAPSSKRTLTVAQSGKTRAVKRRSVIRGRQWVQEYIEERRMNEEAISADPNRALSRFLARHEGGLRFEYHDAATFFSDDNGGQFEFAEDLSLVGTFVFSDDFYPETGELAPRIDGGPLFNISGRLLPYVA